MLKRYINNCCNLLHNDKVTKCDNHRIWISAWGIFVINKKIFCHICVTKIFFCSAWDNKNNNWKFCISLHFLYIWADRLEWINKLTGNSFQLNPPCHLLRILPCVIINVKKNRSSVLWLCVFALHDVTHIYDTESYKNGKSQIKIQILYWIWLLEAKHILFE